MFQFHPRSMIPQSRRLAVNVAAGLTLVCAAWLPMAAHAQDLTPERVQFALETTDRRIEQAEALVSATDNATAEAELSAARDLQSRARSALSSNQLVLAMKLTLDARRRAERAIALVKNLPDPDRVETQLERTRELIQRTRERVEECNADRAKALVRAAAEMQVRAEESASSGRFLVALQLTMGARERAQRALRMCRMEENLQESAERALRRTDDVIARAQDPVDRSGSELARQALGRAVDLQARAQQDYRGGYFESCLRQTQSARTFAYRAARLSGGGGRR